MSEQEKAEKLKKELYYDPETCAYMDCSGCKYPFCDDCQVREVNE